MAYLSSSYHSFRCFARVASPVPPRINQGFSRASARVTGARLLCRQYLELFHGSLLRFFLLPIDRLCIKYDDDDKPARRQLNLSYPLRRSVAASAVTSRVGEATRFGELALTYRANTYHLIPWGSAQRALIASLPHVTKTKQFSFYQHNAQLGIVASETSTSTVACGELYSSRR